jgi:hypothetical protein
MAERFGELIEAEIQVLLGKALENALRRQIMKGNYD